MPTFSQEAGVVKEGIKPGFQGTSEAFCVVSHIASLELGNSKAKNTIAIMPPRMLAFHTSRQTLVPFPDTVSATIVLGGQGEHQEDTMRCCF